MVNDQFEEYYKVAYTYFSADTQAQKIVPEDEWDQFMDTLKVELPTTFRVTGSRAHADVINNQIKDLYVPTMQNVELDGVKYDPPKPIPWYPEQLAWEIAAPKRVVRKSEPFKQFQRFLVGETEVGNLSRQEAVSMIPPLLMDVEPHHVCLDMCAAPGSKTAQIIEALNPHHTESTGMLIANDADYKRTHMLVHQTGRMPSKGLIVVNNDATQFPNISLGPGAGNIKYDRILADVPCSGDGTMRKNLEIWKKWAPFDGNSLHTVQLRILERAMNMLKPGGRLVYSTCSFNPSENEAVVAAALNSHPDFEIVDVADKLPELKRRPGIHEWKVATRDKDENIKWHESHEAYEAYRAESGSERDNKSPLPASCWAPANAAELHLERALRLLPHDQNTGGFFVCVLEKKGTSEPTVVPASSLVKREVKSKFEEPKAAEATAPMAEDKSDEKEEAPAVPAKRELSPSAEESEAKKLKSDAPQEPQDKKAKRDLAFREDPFGFVDPSHPELETVKAWFGMTPDFPAENLLVRNEYGNPLRTIYIVNDLVKAVILNNDYTRLRMISAGVKAFIRQDSQSRSDIQCKWRVSSDGILGVVRYIPEDRIVKAGIKELRTFLEEMYPPVTKFEGAFRDTCEKAEFGNMLVLFEAGEGAGGKLNLPLYLPCWKAKSSMSLLIDKREKSVLSNRVFGEDICKPAPPPRSREEKEAEAAAAAKEAAEKGMPVPTPLETPAMSTEATPAPTDEEAAMNA